MEDAYTIAGLRAEGDMSPARGPDMTPEQAGRMMLTPDEKTRVLSPEGYIVGNERLLQMIVHLNSTVDSLVDLATGFRAACRKVNPLEEAVKTLRADVQKIQGFTAQAHRASPTSQPGGGGGNRTIRPMPPVELNITSV